MTRALRGLMRGVVVTPDGLRHRGGASRVDCANFRHGQGRERQRAAWRRRDGHSDRDRLQAFRGFTDATVRSRCRICRSAHTGLTWRCRGSALTRTGIVLQVNANPVINVTLPLGDLAETVSVEAAAPLIETRSPSIGAGHRERAHRGAAAQWPAGDGPDRAGGRGGAGRGRRQPLDGGRGWHRGCRRADIRRRVYA